METQRSDPDYERMLGHIFIFVAFFFPLWIIVVLPMAVWIVCSAAYKVVEFVFVLINGPPIGLLRWLIAVGILFAGFVLELFYLVMLFSVSSNKGKMKRIAIASIPLFLFLAVPFLVLFRGVIWLLGRVIPVEVLYLSAEGPVSLGQAMGHAVGLLCWPLLLFVGTAKGVLLGGHPARQFGCAVIHDAVAAGLLDVSSVYHLGLALVSLPWNYHLLEMLGFSFAPPVYNLNWWGTVSLAAYIEAGGEVVRCYVSGSLDAFSAGGPR
jgi:hypothetical protein